MVEALGKIQGIDEKLTKLRYQVVLEALMNDCSFYNNDFHPFLPSSYSISNLNYKINKSIFEPI